MKFTRMGKEQERREEKGELGKERKEKGEEGRGKTGRVRGKGKRERTGREEERREAKNGKERGEKGGEERRGITKIEKETKKKREERKRQEEKRTKQKGKQERGRRKRKREKEERQEKRGRRRRKKPTCPTAIKTHKCTCIYSTHTSQLTLRYGAQAGSYHRGKLLILPDPPPRCNANHHTNNKSKRAVRMARFTTAGQLLGTYCMEVSGTSLTYRFVQTNKVDANGRKKQ